MENRILASEPEGSELERWAEDGIRREPHHSNIVVYVSPDESFSLTVEVDDPVHGYLIRLQTGDEQHDRRIGQAVVDDRELALDIAAQMAAAATDLDAVDERPQLGPETVYVEDLDENVAGGPDTPEEWDDEEEWRDALEKAWEKADIPRGKGTLTTKTIDDRDYYYLQWREGDTVTSQYVAPVSPAE
jgi:hypothetical protein